VVVSHDNMQPLSSGGPKRVQVQAMWRLDVVVCARRANSW